MKMHEPTVVDFGEFKIQREAATLARKQDACAHHRLTLIDVGGLVQCRDCKVHVSPYWALHRVTVNWEQRMNAHNARQAALDEAASKTVVLRAARKVEHIWRKRNMVPACPHCNRGILPEDNLGDAMVSRHYELAARGSKE